MRNGVRVEEDSDHTTSQIIVDTSGNTVYNNTLRVRGRETGRYDCSVSNNRNDYIQGSPNANVMKLLQGMLYNNRLIYLVLIAVSILAPSKPLSLNATYKTPTAVSLEWTFAVPLIYDTSYVVYYESGGGSHTVSFRGEHSERDNSHMLTDLPVGGIYNISLVALVHLPSPLAGPVSPGMSIHNN